jgi:hypothetical protein
MVRKRADRGRGQSDHAYQPPTPLEDAASKEWTPYLPPLLQEHADFLKAKLGQVTLQMPFEKAFGLLDLLKLAVRYPGLHPDALRLGRELLEDMIAEFNKQSPGVADWLRRGDHGEGKGVQHGK